MEFWGINSTAIEAIRGEMGWITFMERVVKVNFNVPEIKGLSTERWVKKILNVKGNPSWKKEMEQWKLRDKVEEEWQKLGSKIMKGK